MVARVKSGPPLNNLENLPFIEDSMVVQEGDAGIKCGNVCYDSC